MRETELSGFNRVKILACGCSCIHYAKVAKSQPSIRLPPMSRIRGTSGNAREFPALSLMRNLMRQLIYIIYIYDNHIQRYSFCWCWSNGLRFINKHKSTQIGSRDLFKHFEEGCVGEECSENPWMSGCTKWHHRKQFHHIHVRGAANRKNRMMMRGEGEFAIRVPAVVTEDFSPQIPREVILRLASQHLLIWKLIWNSTSCSRIPVYFKVALLTERMVWVPSTNRQFAIGRCADDVLYSAKHHRNCKCLMETLDGGG